MACPRLGSQGLGGDMKSRLTLLTTMPPNEWATNIIGLRLALAIYPDRHQIISRLVS